MSDENKGVLVDNEGFFIGAVTWPATMKRPQINAPNTPREQRNRMLPAAFFDEHAEEKRFDFDKQEWVKASGFASVVNARGDFLQKVRYFKGYEHRLPTLSPGLEYVFKPKPKNEKTFRWIWSGADWVRPDVVAVIEGDKIVSAALQNPREDQPNVADILPAGQSVLVEWPAKADGEYARIGATFVDGEWVDPAILPNDG